MANEEHLKILKQGVDTWNRWRKDNPDIQPDLYGMDLRELKIAGANLNRTILSWTYLSDTDLSSQKLQGAILSNAHLTRARLTEADLRDADLRGTNLREANLDGADLYRTDLVEANMTEAALREVNLVDADLRWSILNGTSLDGADLTGARIGWTTFGDVDLSVVEGLSKAEHVGPSTIGIDTIHRSKGDIPQMFLRGAGVPDSMIEFARSLVASEHAIDYYSCFISYSSSDQGFAERLYADLQANGVRCWFAPEDMKIGDKLRPTLDRSVQLHDKLLIVLSENSIGSDWVEQEVETALAQERKEERTVLFPIRLDDTVMEIDVGWPALIRNTRHIGDFRNWKDHDAYQQAFRRLLRDLKAEDS